MTSRYGIREARPILGDLIRDAQLGADIIISRNGKPAVRLTPIKEEPMFTDRDLKNWVMSIHLPDGALSEDAVDMVAAELNDRYDLIGPNTGDRAVTDDIDNDELWSIVEKAMDKHP